MTSPLDSIRRPSFDTGLCPHPGCDTEAVRLVNDAYQLVWCASGHLSLRTSKTVVALGNLRDYPEHRAS